MTWLVLAAISEHLGHSQHQLDMEGDSKWRRQSLKELRRHNISEKGKKKWERQSSFREEQEAERGGKGGRRDMKTGPARGHRGLEGVIWRGL